MIGVTCMDASLIASSAMIDARPDASTFYDRVTADQTACNRRTPTPAQLQELRRRIDRERFGDAVCTAVEMGVPAAPEPRSCTDGGGGNGTAPPSPSTDGGSGGGSGPIIG